MNKYKIYTDGGCDPNPGGTGGWAFLVIDGDRVVERSGRVEHTTSNRMELTAAVNALQSLRSPAEVELLTDSQYLARGMTEWIFGWKKKGWKLKDGSPVKNLELWQKLDELGRKFKVQWTWVRGHADDAWNARVDKLVKNAIKGKIISSEAAKPLAVSAVPEVKIRRQKGKPASVTISLKSGGGVQIDQPVSLKIAPRYLQKLIEDLIAALRKIEES